MNTALSDNFYDGTAESILDTLDVSYYNLDTAELANHDYVLFYKPYTVWY